MPGILDLTTTTVKTKFNYFCLNYGEKVSQITFALGIIAVLGSTIAGPALIGKIGLISLGYAGIGFASGIIFIYFSKIIEKKTEDLLEEAALENEKWNQKLDQQEYQPEYDQFVSDFSSGDSFPGEEVRKKFFDEGTKIILKNINKIKKRQFVPGIEYCEGITFIVHEKSGSYPVQIISDVESAFSLKSNKRDADRIIKNKKLHLLQCTDVSYIKSDSLKILVFKNWKMTDAVTGSHLKKGMTPELFKQIAIFICETGFFRLNQAIFFCASEAGALNEMHPDPLKEKKKTNPRLQWLVPPTWDREVTIEKVIDGLFGPDAEKISGLFSLISSSSKKSYFDSIMNVLKEYFDRGKIIEELESRDYYDSLSAYLKAPLKGKGE